jgi:hypothetical protein
MKVRDWAWAIFAALVVSFFLIPVFYAFIGWCLGVWAEMFSIGVIP